jgi:hypothetical protein
MTGNILAHIDADMVESGTIVRSGIKKYKVAREHL